MIDENNKAFCILPFVHTHLNTEGDVFPCCVGWSPDRRTRLGFLKDNTLEELFNSEEMKQLRIDMVNGVRNHKFCDSCYRREDNGFVSARNGNNIDFDINAIASKMKPDGYLEPDIKSWDIRFSNLCNLKCRTCGSVYSTTWAAEEEQYGHSIGMIKSVPVGMDPLEKQYDNVEKIYFAGGEPLIMPEHFKTLQELIDRGRAKHVKLVYNTNMTKLNYNNIDLTSYWKEFKQVVLGMSIDALGDRAEYIRNGIKWDIIENNIRTVCEMSKQHKNITYHISPTVSVLNVHSIPDMHKFFVDSGLLRNVNDIILNILLGPSYFEIRNLSNKLKEEIKLKFINHIEWLKQNNVLPHVLEQFESVLTYIEMPQNEKDIIEFVANIRLIDYRRKQSFPATFPEYTDWWEEILSGVSKW